MGLWRKLKEKRAERKADREAIEREREENLRVDDEPPRSMREPFDEGFLSGLKQ